MPSPQQHRSQRTRLGQLLVDRGWITGEQLIRAIQSQRAVGGRIGTCLLEMDVLSEDRLLDALAEQLETPAAGVDTLRSVGRDVLTLVPESVAVRCQAIPFLAADGVLNVATLNVANLGFLDEIAFCSEKRVRPHIANEVRVFEALERYYGVSCPERYGHLLDRLNRARYLWSDDAQQALAAETASFTREAIDEVRRSVAHESGNGGTAVGERPKSAPPVPMGRVAADRSPAQTPRQAVTEPAKAEPPVKAENDSPIAERPPETTAAPVGTSKADASTRTTVPDVPSGDPAHEATTAATPTQAATAATPTQAAAAATPTQAAAAATPKQAAAATAATQAAATTAPDPGPAKAPPPSSKTATAAPEATSPVPARQRIVATTTDTSSKTRPQIAHPDRTAAETASDPEALLSLRDLERLLARSADIQEVGRSLMRYLAQSFHRSALFKVKRDVVVGWLAHGADIDADVLGRYRQPLDQPSVFQGLAARDELHLGPLEDSETHRKLARCWSGSLPASCLVAPIRVRDRLLAVVYGDRGEEDLTGLKREQLQRLVSKASLAFEMCLLRRKIDAD